MFAAVIPDPAADLGGFLAALLGFVVDREWIEVAAAALVGVVYVVRLLAAKWPFASTDAGGALIVLGTSILGSVGAALATSGTFSWSVVWGGVVVGWTAAGAYATLRKIGRWFVPLAWAWIRARLFPRAAP